MMFLNLTFISTMICISSMSWLTAWIGLEMNLLSMMPLMKMFNNKYSAEAMMKYFIIQTMASMMLLFSIIMYLNFSKSILYMKFPIHMILNSSLILKLGMAPFHFWLPEVSSGLNWSMNMMLLTWQKIAPMILLSYTIKNIMFFSIIIITSSLMGGLQGMNQTCLRKLMAYSSINHMSWMTSTLFNSLNIWLYYFCIYSLINLNIMIIFYKYNMFFIKNLNNLYNFNKKLKLMFMMNFLSLGGLPPFLGFFPKWLTINFLIKYNFYILSMLLILISSVSLYFYMRLTFTSISINSNETLLKNYFNIKFMYFFVNFINLMSLNLILILTNFM
uniref:NADH-ubiquinone oxidoreductase chain 2 n=1 Tax=Curculionoidea sp. 4 KM-2017 TaxID=2219417 RepID=A0A346RI74_9CUCU|nr:NADH dehydrogenase subunit 2 [Curculionoidea sp. 4 KM-2017]